MIGYFKKNVYILFLLLFALCAIITITVWLKPSDDKLTIKNQDKVINELTQSNADTAKTLENQRLAKDITNIILEQGDRVKSDIQLEHRTNHTQNENTVDLIKQDYDTKIAITKDINEINVLIKVREQEVSKTRINLLWKQYCQQEPNEAECKGSP